MDSFFKQDLIYWAFLILETPGRMDVTYNRFLQIYFLCVALLRGSSLSRLFCPLYCVPFMGLMKK